MAKYVVISVINREISSEFTETIEQAKTRMKSIYKSYLEDEEDLTNVDYGEDSCACWITGNYNNVDIEIHEIPCKQF